MDPLAEARVSLYRRPVRLLRRLFLSRYCGDAYPLYAVYIRHHGGTGRASDAGCGVDEGDISVSEDAVGNDIHFLAATVVSQVLVAAVL